MIKGLHLIHVMVFAVLAVFHLWVWMKQGFRLPRYVHVLAVIAFMLGIVMVLSLQQQGLGKSAATNFLMMLLCPAIVYGVFVLYGGVKEAPMPEAKVNSKPPEAASSLQQQNPFTDIKP